MMKVFLSLLLITLIITEAVDNGLLRCPTQTLEYEYTNIMLQSKENKEQNGKTEIHSKVEITCLFETNKGNFYFHLDLHSFKMTVEGKEKKVRNEDFENFSSFVITPNGKIIKFWTSKKEATNASWITSIKKGIIENFQTKLNGKQRLQHSQEGDVIVHYEQKHEHDGSILIEAKKIT